MDLIKAREMLFKGMTIYDMELNVAFYSRVSTDKEEQLNSLDNQANYFKDMINDCKKWNYVNSYVDEGITGTRVYKRERFLQMIEDAKKGKIDLILTKEVSRFARNTVDSINYTELLLKHGVIVYFITDNINTIYPDSEFRLTLMASIAQDEVRKLSERVKFGIKRSIKDGKVFGGGNITGYYNKNGKLIINEEEKLIIEMLFNLYVTGEYGFSKISEKLASSGYLTKKGKKFSDTTLKKMLQNPKYKGYYIANKSYVEDYKTHKKKINPREKWIVYKDYNSCPPIVNEELWDKANEIYMKRKKHWNKYIINKNSYLEKKTYTSILFCREHNCCFIKNASGKRKNNPVWQCNLYLRHGTKSCQSPIIPEKKLNSVLINIVNKFIVEEKTNLKNIVNDYQKIIMDIEFNNNLEYLKKKLKEQEKLKERLLDFALRKIISDEDYITKISKINKEITKLESIMTQKNKNDNLKEQLDQIKQILNLKTNVNKNLTKYVNLLIEKIIITKINESRKHLSLEIIFKLDRNSEFVNLNI